MLEWKKWSDEKKPVPWGSFFATSNVSSFHSLNVHLDIMKIFYLPTDAQENSFKNSIKIYINTGPTRFGLITIIRKRNVWACKCYCC
jgi:hypothetical protein